METSTAVVERASGPRMALNARELAERLGISERHVWRLHNGGKLPRPVRLGRSVRWLVAEIDDWLKADTPDRARSAAMKGDQQR